MRMRIRGYTDDHRKLGHWDQTKAMLDRNGDRKEMDEEG